MKFTAGRRMLTAVLLWVGINTSALALDPGEMAPELMLARLGGEHMVSLSEYRGNIVYVDFWASWCGPCRQSLPLYEDLHRSLTDSNFQILAVNLDENRDDANRFLNEHPVSYPVLLDPSGESARRWSVKAMPSSYLVGSDGRLAQIYYGFKPSHMKRIEHDIKILLEDLPPAQPGRTGGLR